MADSVERITPPFSFNRAGKAVFLFPMTVAKEIERNEEDEFLLGRTLIEFFKFHLRMKLVVEREVLFSEEFMKRRVKVAKMPKVDGSSLSVNLGVGEKELERTLAPRISRKSRTVGFLNHP